MIILVGVIFKNDQREFKIAKLELDNRTSKDDSCVLDNDDKILMKKRKILCMIAKRRYRHMT